MKSDKFILFDFDGVIADSYEPALRIYQQFYPTTTREDWEKRYEGNVYDTAREELKRAPINTTGASWLDSYLKIMKEEVDIFPGMKEIILELEKEYTLVIISSTISFPIEEFLDTHDLRSHFDWVMGSDVHTSKVEKIKMVFERYNTTAEHCIFITDTLGDLREAEKMNVESLAVSWGFNTVETLRKGKHVIIVEKPEEIPGSIASFFAKTAAV